MVEFREKLHVLEAAGSQGTGCSKVVRRPHQHYIAFEVYL